MDQPTDRVLGGLYGLLVGDAVGVPYEFHAPENLPPLELIDIEPPADFRRAHGRAPRGAWSDDGAQALCLLSSLLQHGRLDLNDLCRRFVNWWDWGYMAVDGVVFDIGGQTSQALSAYIAGTPVERAAPREERHNGNGSLMRVLPLALWHRGSDEELARDAGLQSTITHAHPRSQVCCALYCLWARSVQRGENEPWQQAVATLRRISANDPSWKNELEEHVRPDAPPGGKGSGYVVDCLHSARLALEESTFERVIQRAVSFGNDTDTTAAVAGGIAGLRHGFREIPDRWLSALAGSATLDPVVQDLLSYLTS